MQNLLGLYLPIAINNTGEFLWGKGTFGLLQASEHIATANSSPLIDTFQSSLALYDVMLMSITL